MATATVGRGVVPGEQGEGTISKEIEYYTSQVPLQLAGRKHAAEFVGHWVPTILILGLYNKIVKLEGSE